MRSEPLLTPAGAVLPGPLLLTPEVYGDERGFFFESWNDQRFAAALAAADQAPCAFVQDNHSRSGRGVLRGLHWQLPPQAQAKLVRCVVGEIFDVVVDLRRSSPSFGQWGGARLGAANHRQLWIPEGFAHGFLTLTAAAEVLYKASAPWSRPAERSLRWDDPALAIAWPLAELTADQAADPAAGPPQLSAKDAAAPLLAALTAADLFP